jgi:hypothetical protein
MDTQGGHVPSPSQTNLSSDSDELLLIARTLVGVVSPQKQQLRLETVQSAFRSQPLWTRAFS